MTTKQTLPPIEEAAAMLLPGLRHARSLIEVAIRVLQYFEVHTKDGVQTVVPKKPDEKLAEEVEQVKALLSAFGQLLPKGR